MRLSAPRSSRHATACAPPTTPEATLRDCAALCIAIGADGLRGELTLLRAARALAAYEGAAAVTRDHLAQVAPLALSHRLRRDPLDEAGSATRVARATVRGLGMSDSPDWARALRALSLLAVDPGGCVASPCGRGRPGAAGLRGRARAPARPRAPHPPRSVGYAAFRRGNIAASLAAGHLVNSDPGIAARPRD